MTQLSMNLNDVGSRAPATDHEFELLPDLLEELEQAPRETVLAILEVGSVSRSPPEPEKRSCL